MDEMETISVEPPAGEIDELTDVYDVLGGRYNDIPDDVHKDMVKKATKGLIPITTPKQRRFLALKRRTYHGNIEWKLPVKYGYVHPTLPPPKGFFWKHRLYQVG